VNTRKIADIDFAQLSDQELNDLLDQVRKEHRERERRRRRGNKYVIDSRTIAGVRWTKELVPCGNPKCRRCRERAEFHGPYWKPWRYTGGKMKAGKPQREPPTGWE
jgi:hypothetical protein